jgi:hypothetical protein
MSDCVERADRGDQAACTLTSDGRWDVWKIAVTNAASRIQLCGFNQLDTTRDRELSSRTMRMLIAVVLLGVMQSRPAVSDLAWISGCWETTRNGRHIVEHWSAPEGGTLMGMGRTVASGKTAEYEFLLIREGAAGLEYVAKPSGQAEAIFTSVKVSADEVVFENPQHDFPTRIIYRRGPNDGLTAAVEGPRNGKTQRIEYPYTRAACK